jgi:hypothetical protein
MPQRGNPHELNLKLKTKKGVSSKPDKYILIKTDRSKIIDLPMASTLVGSFNGSRNCTQRVSMVEPLGNVVFTS